MFRQPHLHIDDDAWRREIAYIDVIINSLFDWSIQFHEFKTTDEALEWLKPIVFEGLHEDVLKDGLKEKDYEEFKVEMEELCRRYLSEHFD